MFFLHPAEILGVCAYVFFIHDWVLLTRAAGKRRGSLNFLRATDIKIIFLLPFGRVARDQRGVDLVPCHQGELHRLLLSVQNRLLGVGEDVNFGFPRLLPGEFPSGAYSLSIIQLINGQDIGCTPNLKVVVP